MSDMRDVRDYFDQFYASGESSDWDRARAFELQYGMSSLDFYALYRQDGSMDTYDYNYWGALVRGLYPAEIAAPPAEPDIKE